MSDNFNSEISFNIDEIRSLARPPKDKEIEYVGGETEIIDGGKVDKDGHSEYPFNYVKPKEAVLSEGEQKVYEVPVFLDGVVVHCKGEGANFFEGINVAKVALVDNGNGGEPKMIISDAKNERLVVTLPTESGGKMCRQIRSLDEIMDVAGKIHDLDKLNEAHRLKNFVFGSDLVVDEAVAKLAQGVSSRNVALGMSAKSN